MANGVNIFFKRTLSQMLLKFVSHDLLCFCSDFGSASAGIFSFLPCVGGGETARARIAVFPWGLVTAPTATPAIFTTTAVIRVAFVKNWQKHLHWLLVGVVVSGKYFVSREDGLVGEFAIRLVNGM